MTAGSSPEWVRGANILEVMNFALWWSNIFRQAMVSGVDGSSDNHDVSHVNQILCICTKAKSGDN